MFKKYLLLISAFTLTINYHTNCSFNDQETEYVYDYLEQVRILLKELKELEELEELKEAQDIELQTAITIFNSHALNSTAQDDNQAQEQLTNIPDKAQDMLLEKEVQQRSSKDNMPKPTANLSRREKLWKALSKSCPCR